MRKRGRGPRRVFVKKYRRWRDGEIQRVKSSLRGIDPVLAVRASRRQLDLGLEDPSGSAR
jgi:hypothetical protein